MLRVSEDSGVRGVSVSGEGKARLRGADRDQNPRRDEVDLHSAAECERHGGDGDGRVVGEVEARVQDRVRRRRRVILHPLLERRAQGGVRRRRQPRDHRAGVDDRAARREDGLPYRERLAADGDGGDGDEVERGALRGVERREPHALSGASGLAEGEVAGGARLRREAVGEVLPVPRRGLGYDRERVPAEAN